MSRHYIELEEYINWISSFGKDALGGITRLLYTDSWLQAQKALKVKFEELGMQANFDEVGNLSGRVEGTGYAEETIATGSHVDTVVNGGKLDGQFGIIGGMIAIKNLIAKHGKPKRSLEVISFAEEEGSRFPYGFWGSKNIFSLASENEVKDLKDNKEKSFIEEMRRCGFDFKKNNNGRKDIKTFIELHIEQGNYLEMNNKSVGVVKCIVGQRRYEVVLKGESNHGGTTLMKYRKDTIEAFAKIVTESLEKARKEGEPLVLTFGRVVPKPNIINVVPGETSFTIDCRHTDKEVLDIFTKTLEKDIKRIAEEMNMVVEINRWMDEPPIPMDKKIISIIENACKEKSLSYKLMDSGAGHDAQIFASQVPTGMIFVPSINGISHNPEEDTKLEDLIQGIKALEATLFELAYIK